MSDSRTDKCELCGKATSFERKDVSMPPEGNVCGICDTWVCDECTNYGASPDGDQYCVECRPRVAA